MDSSETHLEDVVVHNAERFGDLLGEREYLRKVFVGDLVHSIRMV